MREIEASMEPYHRQDVLAQDTIVIVALPSSDCQQMKLEKKEIKPVSLSFSYLCWQKMLNIFFGIIGFFLLSILLPFLALLIYLESPGPIFYHQERVGYCGRKFLMHKFRSMYPDKEHPGRLLWRTAGDQRVTRIGRFMRATHIDELPQVVNILRGEMTLIGPRPERPEYVAELEKSNPLYRSRLTVKPGLTGWAQVNYGYGNSYRDDLIKLQYDLYYIENCSFKLDLLILLKTIMEVIRHRGDK